MTPGDQYRIRAAELMAKAQGEAAAPVRLEYESLALAYLRLAEQADRNAATDVVYEHAPKGAGEEHQPPLPKTATEE
jgi:hypothetical protein